MSSFLRLFKTRSEYDTYIANVGENTRPETCYCREDKSVSYFPIIVNIICSDNIESETLQCTATARGKKITSNISWRITSGNSYATITQNGLLTVLNGANNSSITIEATYGVSIGTKNCVVTYAQGKDISTDIIVTENEDGTTTETTIITTEDSDGSSVSERNAIIYSEEGEVLQTSEQIIESESDGSYNSVTNIFDAEGNKTNTTNETGDVDGNIDTQDIEYDENGQEVVVGYTIDTTNNPTGKGKQITTEEVNTEYYAFDTTSAFECMIHFKFVPTGQVNQATILNAKRADPEPWYGFDLRRNSTTNNIQYGAQFNATNNRANINRPSNDIYKIKITYNPTVPSGQKTFEFYDMLNNKSLYTSTLKFPDLNELKYLKISIGCALDANVQPQRRAKVDVYDFYVRKIR